MAAAAVTCYTVGTIKEIPGLAHVRQRRRGDERQPAAGLVRQRLRGLPGPAGRSPAPSGHDRRQALRVGRRHRPGRRQVPADVAVGDVLATPVTGAYGHSMASTYNKVPRPPVVFVRDGSTPSRRATGNARRPLGTRPVEARPNSPAQPGPRTGEKVLPASPFYRVVACTFRRGGAGRL